MKTSIGIVLILLFSLTVPLGAQVTEASIFGTVSDPSGGAIVEADVSVTNTQTNAIRSVKSQSNGAYVFKALPIGTYDVTVVFPGFKKYQRSGVLLDVNRTARVDAVLSVGAISESVVVVADAALVNVSDAQIGRTVENREIMQLPLVNRDVYALLNLTPGVQLNATANTVGFRQTTVAINGSGDGGTASVAYFLDGGPNVTGLRNTGNAIPNPDAIREFRALTSGYTAEFGKFAAGVVDVVTKSGTNAFHGSLFEFLRNDALNANDWGVLSKPPQRRNQFGGAVGGPVYRNKLFAFGSYSGLRQRFQDVLNGAVVPTASERAGDFSASAKKPSGPGIASAVISASTMDSTALAILKAYVPSANLAANKWQGAVPRPSDLNDLNARLDYVSSKGHQVMGSYFRSEGFEFQKAGGNIPWSQQKFDWTQHNLNIEDSWVLNSSTVNQLHLAYVRNFGGRTNLPGLSLADLGSKFTIQGRKSLPQITVSGYFTLFEAIQGPIAGSNYYAVRDSFSLVRGAHALKFGGDLALEKSVQDTSLNNYGVWSFDGSKTGNALADFMVGLPASFKQDAPVTKIDNDWNTGLFIQDHFRIHSRLTIDMGLRYEHPTPFADPFNRKLTFSPGVQSTIAPNAPTGLLFPGDSGVSRPVARLSQTMFAPRLGFAWDPFGTGKTSVRGGAGIYYGSTSSNNANMTADFQPFAARQTFPNVKTLSDPYGNMPGGSPFPIRYDPQNLRLAFTPGDVSTLAQDFDLPSTYQLNLSIERQLLTNLSVVGSYVGALARHLPFTIDRNYPVWSPGATAANLPSRRPYLAGTLGIINYEDGIVSASYHGLQTSLRKRLSHGVSLQISYTFSKSLEGAQTQNNTPTGGAENFRNLALERARTNNDRRHVLLASGIWEMNYFKNSRFLRQTLNGWSLSMIATAKSGAPLTCLTGQDNNVDGNATDRCNIIGNPTLSPGRSRGDVVSSWFNKSAFNAPIAGTDGNSSRNLLDGPGQTQVDLALARVFRAGERVKLELRGEMTNALNLVNLNAPVTTLNSSAFGTINAAGPMRQSQLGLRLLW